MTAPYPISELKTLHNIIQPFAIWKPYFSAQGETIEVFQEFNKSPLRVKIADFYECVKNGEHFLDSSRNQVVLVQKDPFASPQPYLANYERFPVDESFFTTTDKIFMESKGAVFDEWKVQTTHKGEPTLHEVLSLIKNDYLHSISSDIARFSSIYVTSIREGETRNYTHLCYFVRMEGHHRHMILSRMIQEKQHNMNLLRVDIQLLEKDLEENKQFIELPEQPQLQN